MIKSIHFEVKKWEYHPETSIADPHTDVSIWFHPLRSSGDLTKAHGLNFRWVLKLTDNPTGKLILEYESWEYFIIPLPVTNNELGHIALQSYRKTKEEVSERNATVGLNATFPAFEKIKVHKNYSQTREMLNMKYPNR